MPRTLHFAVLCGLALSGTPALAQDLIDGTDPARVLEIARGYGFAELDTDAQGDPMVVARMNGTAYRVFFYGCSDGRDCSSLQFWTYSAAPADALVAVNDWNREFRFGSAFIDADGDVAIRLDVNLFGGVSGRNLDDTFDWWRIVLQRARDHFDLPQDDPAPPPDIGKTL